MKAFILAKYLHHVSEANFPRTNFKSEILSDDCSVICQCFICLDFIALPGIIFALQAF